MSGVWRIFPLGDSAVTVEFGNAISVELNARSIALADHLEAHPFPGFVEAVPAYASTTIFYDPVVVTGSSSAVPAHQVVTAAVENGISHLVVEPIRTPQGAVIEIPVDFTPEAALDLNEVAERSSLDADRVIELFTSVTYRVFMLGFLPGFTYMAEVDERIAVPRRETPRLSVPKGSVGIAGRQTGIYSLESPGGWQIIGRTEVEMLTPTAAMPTLLKPGDHVRFIPAQ